MRPLLLDPPAQAEQIPARVEDGKPRQDFTTKENGQRAVFWVTVSAKHVRIKLRAALIAQQGKWVSWSVCCQPPLLIGKSTGVNGVNGESPRRRPFQQGGRRGRRVRPLSWFLIRWTGGGQDVGVFGKSNVEGMGCSEFAFEGRQRCSNESKVIALISPEPRWLHDLTVISVKPTDEEG